MPKEAAFYDEALFTMKLESELRDELMAEAEAAHRPASQMLRELMREFVQRQHEAREFDEFLRRKVEAARASMHAGIARLPQLVTARCRSAIQGRRRPGKTEVGLPEIRSVTKH